MCEFCTQHGEGKIWYLQMKNYARELLHAELSANQQEVVQAATRYEWNQRFWKYFVMPAITGISPAGEDAFRSRKLDEVKIEHFGQVIPMEDVEAVLERVDSIVRIPCGCRFFHTGKTDQRYCFGLGMDQWNILGSFPESKVSLEVLTHADAQKAIRKYDDEGLVHSIWTGVTPYVIGICNCDHDCGALRSYFDWNSPNFFHAEYVCQVDWDRCTGCKNCMSQCQFGALFYSSAQGKVWISPKKCFGCGVCRAACPNDAISLVSRQSVPEAAQVWL
jgi:ferredoxin